MTNPYPHINQPQPVLPSLQSLHPLKGQTALVTGANSGIGRAIALALGRSGANVVVNYVARPEDAESVAAEVRAAGAGAITAMADVSDEAQVQAMFAAATSEFGGIDILASNAGLETERALPRDDRGAVGQGHQRQPARRLPVRARGGARLPEARRAARGVGGGRQDHLHQLGARGHSLGEPCQLCGLQGRADAADEEPGAGGGASSASASIRSRPAPSARPSTPPPGPRPKPMPS